MTQWEPWKALVTAFGSHAVPQSARPSVSPAHTVAFAYTPEMAIASPTETNARTTHGDTKRRRESGERAGSMLRD